MPASHVVVSAATSIAFGCAARSWPAGVACFLSGVFIDLDHILEFWIAKRKICCSPGELLDFCIFLPSERVFLVLHAYELILAAWVAAFYFHASPLWFGALLGVSVHILLDQAVNPVMPLAYFWFYRRRHGFSRDLFLNEKRLKKISWRGFL